MSLLDALLALMNNLSYTGKEQFMIREEPPTMAHLVCPPCTAALGLRA